ncbi:hypothetical protein ACVR1G_01605 [Streptococcus dentasini]
MKLKLSYIIYALIGTVCAVLSTFTTVFEQLKIEVAFSYLGEFMGLLISATILISIAQFLIEELTD